MKNTIALIAILTTLSLAHPAHGQERSTFNTSAHRHQGLSLHMDLGMGYTKTSCQTDPLGDFTIQGSGAELGITLGTSVLENLILAGHAWGANIIAPQVTLGGVALPTNDDTTLTILGLGPNLTYYLMPINMFLSVTPSITSINLKSSGTQYETRSGIGLHAAIGTEWWISAHWGLGLASQLMISSNRGNDSSSDSYSTIAGALALSATYN